MWNKTEIIIPADFCIGKTFHVVFAGSWPSSPLWLLVITALIRVAVRARGAVLQLGAHVTVAIVGLSLQTCEPHRYILEEILWTVRTLEEKSVNTFLLELLLLGNMKMSISRCFSSSSTFRRCSSGMMSSQSRTPFSSDSGVLSSMVEKLATCSIKSERRYKSIEKELSRFNDNKVKVLP